MEIAHPPDTATLEVLVFKDNMVRLTMFRDGQEVGRTTVHKTDVLALLGEDDD